MARSSTNSAAVPWRILRIRARQLQPGIGRAYADLLGRTPVDSFAAMGLLERYSALTDAMSAAGLSGRLSLLPTAADLLTNTTVMLPAVAQTPTRVIAQWFALAVRGGAGVPLTTAEKAQFDEVTSILSKLPPERRDRVSAYLMYLGTRDSTYAKIALKTVADQGDTVGYPELVALLSLQRGDKATAERLARSFPLPDSLRKSVIGTTGMRMVSRALVLSELGNTRRAVETLEAIDPVRFQRSDALDITWAVYVRQFMLRGQLYEKLDERAKALASYERFLTLWQEAEEPLQPQLREAREAVARLRDAAVTRPG